MVSLQSNHLVAGKTKLFSAILACTDLEARCLIEVADKQMISFGVR